MLTVLCWRHTTDAPENRVAERGRALQKEALARKGERDEAVPR